MNYSSTIDISDRKGMSVISSVF